MKIKLFLELFLIILFVRFYVCQNLYCTSTFNFDSQDTIICYQIFDNLTINNLTLNQALQSCPLNTTLIQLSANFRSSSAINTTDDCNDTYYIWARATNFKAINIFPNKTYDTISVSSLYPYFFCSGHNNSANSNRIYNTQISCNFSFVANLSTSISANQSEVETISTMAITNATTSTVIQSSSSTFSSDTNSTMAITNATTSIPSDTNIQFSTNSTLMIAYQIMNTTITLNNSTLTSFLNSQAPSSINYNGNWSMWYTWSCTVQKKRISGANGVTEIKNFTVNNLKLCDFLSNETISFLRAKYNISAHLAVNIIKNETRITTQKLFNTPVVHVSKSFGYVGISVVLSMALLLIFNDFLNQLRKVKKIRDKLSRRKMKQTAVSNQFTNERSAIDDKIFYNVRNYDRIIAEKLKKLKK